MQRDAIWRSRAGRQGDHALDRARTKQRPPDPASRPPRSDRRRQQEHGHAAGLQPCKSMLNPCQLGLRPWWQAVGPPGIGRKLLVPPVPLVEWRVAQDQVSPKLPVRISTQRVAYAHVDSGDVHCGPRRPPPAPERPAMLGASEAETRGSQGGKGQIPISSRKNNAWCLIGRSPLPGGCNQQPASPARGVQDGFRCLWLAGKHVCDDSHQLCQRCRCDTDLADMRVKPSSEQELENILTVRLPGAFDSPVDEPLRVFRKLASRWPWHDHVSCQHASAYLRDSQAHERAVTECFELRP